MAATHFVAEWYDRAKVEAAARAAGWNGVDSLLDEHHPEENPKVVDHLKCPDLQSAVTHLRNVIADGKEFFGQADVLQIESGGSRCRACICGGKKLIKRYVVDETGVVEEHAESSCLDED